MTAPPHIVDIYRAAGNPDPQRTADLAWSDVGHGHATDEELLDAAALLDQLTKD